MIDRRGCELHKIMMMCIARDGEADRSISPSVQEAMMDFDTYMNKLNKTEGILYSKKGEALMEMYAPEDEDEWIRTA